MTGHMKCGETFDVELPFEAGRAHRLRPELGTGCGHLSWILLAVAAIATSDTYIT